MENALQHLIRSVIVEYHFEKYHPEDIEKKSSAIKRAANVIFRLAKETSDIREISNYIGQFYGSLFSDVGPHNIETIARALIHGDKSEEGLEVITNQLIQGLTSPQ